MYHPTGLEAQAITCSAEADASTQHYSLPDLQLRGFQTTLPNSVFPVPMRTELSIYPVPPASLQGDQCSGTVTTVEFCYAENNLTLFFSENYAFTLLILRQSSNALNFTVLDVIPIRNVPSPSECSNLTLSHITVEYCCSNHSLHPSNWFHLPASSDFAFAITNQGWASRTILEYNSPLVQHMRHNIQNGGIPAVGSRLTFRQEDVKADRGLKVFKFLIGESL